MQKWLFFVLIIVNPNHHDVDDHSGAVTLQKVMRSGFEVLVKFDSFEGVDSPLNWVEG